MSGPVVEPLVTPNPATTDWVPMYTIGSGFHYVGAYVSTTKYNDGDIVVGADGVAYLCVVNGTTGVTPVPWAPAPTIPYGTSLPASPVDGQEAVLVDSTTNPSYQWRFRWNTGSASAYKWEFVGGAPFSQTVGPSQEYTSSATYTTLTTAGPSFTTPRAGDYTVQWGCDIQNPAGFTGQMGIAVAGSVAAGNDAVLFSTAGTGSRANVAAVRLKTGLAASTAIAGRYLSSGGTSGFTNRWLTVLPVRVS